MFALGSVIVGQFVTSAVLAAGSASSTTSIAGRWSIAGGVFEFIATGPKNFTNKVIKQRTGIFCPSVNDHNGQIKLTHVSKFVYTGKWEWFWTNTCQSSGYGTVRITMDTNGRTAHFTADPPAGENGTPESYTLRRIK
jgi:hypothetical protein